MSSKFVKLSFIFEQSFIFFLIAVCCDFRFFRIRAVDFNLSMQLLSTPSIIFSSLVKLFVRSKFSGWFSMKNLLLAYKENLRVGRINRGPGISYEDSKSYLDSPISGTTLQELHEGKSV